MPDFTDNLKPAEPSGPSVLASERSNSSLPVKDLAAHLLSRDDFLGRQNRVLSVLLPEPLLSKKTQWNFARPERYKLGLARSIVKLHLACVNRIGKIE